MRIVLVSQEYPLQRAHGGIGSQTYMKAHGLASLGHEVYVIGHSADHRQHERQEGAVHVTLIPGFDEHLPIHTEPVRWLTHSALVAAAVSDRHSRASVDLVDVPEWGGEGYIHLLNQTEWRHIPTLVHLHGPLAMLADTIGWPDKDSEFYRVGTAMESTCLRLADAVCSSSRCSVDWCARCYGLDRERTPILHTGVDTKLFHPHEGPKADRPTILFVGKIVQNKGADLLVEASLRLARDYPGLHLRLLGSGDALLMAQLREKASAAGLPELLDMPGFVQRQELPAHLSRAHVFAAPSLYEGGPGFVYIEAMACGLPVIACEGSGASEAILPGETGFLVPPGDADALAGALGRLLADNRRREAMGARAREHVLATADSKACIARIEAFYRRVAAGDFPAGGAA